MIEFLNGLSARAIFLGGMILLIAGLMFWDRKNVKRHTLLFYRRTKRGIDFIDNIAKSAPRFWNLYGWGGVAAAAIAIPVSFATVVYTFYITIFERSTEQGPSVLAPGLSSQPEIQSGISFFPAEWWFFGIAILLVCHELSHGIVARAEGFEINSVGWIVLGIIPGAFVEPKSSNMLPGGEDEEEVDEDGDPFGPTGMWEQGNWKSNLKVLAAGSWANFVVGALFALLAVGMVQGTTYADSTGYIGIGITSYEDGQVNYTAREGFPAFESGMRNGTLLSINGQPIDEPGGITNFSESISPGDQIMVETSEGTYNMEASEQTLRRYNSQFEEYAGGLSWFTQGLWIVVTFNILIGLFNLAPLKPLDGGHIVEVLIRRFGSERFVPVFQQASGAIFLGLILLVLVSIAGVI